MLFIGFARHWVFMLNALFNKNSSFLLNHSSTINENIKGFTLIIKHSLKSIAISIPIPIKLNTSVFYKLYFRISDKRNIFISRLKCFIIPNLHLLQSLSYVLLGILVVSKHEGFYLHSFARLFGQVQLCLVYVLQQ